MEADDSPDDLMRALKDLAVEDHAPARARRIRDRAVAVLERRRHRARRVAVYSRFMEPTLACALSLGFVLWTLARSIEVLEKARGGFFWP